MTVPLHGSREAELLLTQFQSIIETGFQQRVLQRTPHLVCLSRPFYHKQLKPLLARWLVLWLSFQQSSHLTDQQMLTYLMQPKDGSVSATTRDRAKEAGIIPDHMDQDVMKLLNLGHDWLHSFLPFILGEEMT